MTIFVEKVEDLVGKTIRAVKVDEYDKDIMQLIIQFTDDTYGWIDVVNSGTIMSQLALDTQDAVLCEFGVISDEEYEIRSAQHDEIDKAEFRVKELTELERLTKKYAN